MGAAASSIQIQQGFSLPGYKIDQAYKSGFALSFGSNGIRETLPNLTRLVDVNVIKLRTNAKVISVGGDSNRIPSGDIEHFKIQTPTVSIRTNAEFNSDTIDAFSAVGINYQQVMQSVSRQGINQVIATLALTGNGGSYEGLLNAAGKITTSALLPVDSQGATELASQAAAEVRDALMSLIRFQLAELNLTDESNKVEVVVTTSQRVISILSTMIIPVLTGGAGLNYSVLQNIKDVFLAQGKTITFATDKRHFEKKGASGVKYDRMLITIPEMPANQGGGMIDTNYAGYGNGQPVIAENNLLLASNIVPTEQNTVIENGGIRTLYRINAITSGWNIQSNTVQVVADIKVDA